MSVTTPRTPLVLLIDDQEGTGGTVESILTPKGFVVLRAYTARQALDLVGKVSPDAVLVDADLPDMTGVDLVRELVATRTIQAATSILLLTSEELGRVQRLDALGAGAWDILPHPVDANELILRLDTFVRGKQEMDRIRDEGLTDPDTGIYNVRGILTKTREVAADAARHHRPLTCVVFGPTPERTAPTIGADEASAEAEWAALVEALRQVTRVSDTLGRLGPAEFAVIAPSTDQVGARRLADRVLEAVTAEAGHHGFGVESRPMTQLRAGIYSSGGESGTTAEELLQRATMALRKAQADEGSFRIRAYDA